MNTRDAAYLTGHHYPGGVPALAARMGMDAREPFRGSSPAFPLAGNSHLAIPLGCGFKN